MVETRQVTNGYVTGLLIEALVVSVSLAIAFSILGIRYALLLALVSAAVNVIPYLGILISMALVALVTLTNHSPATALWAVGIRYVIHFLDANLLVPRVIGGKVRINALVTLLGVLAGGAIWGVAGTFLAIPLTAALKIIFSHIPAMQPWALMMDVDDGTGDAAAQSSSTDKP
jgi:predicted PurR-regulated permease PerM